MSVDCRLRFNLITMLKATGLISSGGRIIFQGRLRSPGPELATAKWKIAD